MPLRATLENFLNHIENLEANRSDGDGLEKEFQLLKTLTESLRCLPQYSSQHGESDVNRRKNRYKDIIPYDYTRVTISDVPGIPSSDYVNASYIKGASGSMAYIASQGPLPSTVDEFWRMIWEREIQVIVMACNEIESGKHKCEKYWSDKGEEKVFGNIKVQLVRIKQVCPEFLVRTLMTTMHNEVRTVVQFHYTSWPDHGIPDTVMPILNMVKLIRDCQASETLPILVHCSAGCGRTGTICTIDFVWGLLRSGKLNDNFSLFQLVSNMRKQRIAMVQTKEQYVLVYRVVKELFEQHLKMMDSHPYENIDFSGTPISLLENYCNFIDAEEVTEEAAYASIGVSPDASNSCDTDSEMYDQQSGKVQQLISSWNNSKSSIASNRSALSNEAALTDNDQTHKSNDQSYGHDNSNDHRYDTLSSCSLSTTSLAVSPTNSDTPSEKVVVVRKPSIARLRAIFEKTNASTDSASESIKVNEIDHPQRTKSKKKNRLKPQSSSKKDESITGARYKDAALQIYSEFRQREDVSSESVFNSPDEPIPLTPSPVDASSPEFVRRNSRRNSSRNSSRSSTSVWYDGDEQIKELELDLSAEKSKDKPALPIKRSKSLKIQKLTENSFGVLRRGKESSVTSLDSVATADSKRTSPEKDNLNSSSASSRNKEIENKTALNLPLTKGIVKLKSSPWNPRKSQHNKSSSPDSSNDAPPTKEKQKSWYLFGEKQPEVIAGFDILPVQLIRVKSNADEHQFNNPIVESKEKRSSGQVSSTVTTKNTENCVHEPPLPPKSSDKTSYQESYRSSDTNTDASISQSTLPAVPSIVDDKPPALPVKKFSPANSPRLRHQRSPSKSQSIKTTPTREVAKIAAEDNLEVTEAVPKQEEEKESPPPEASISSKESLETLHENLRVINDFDELEGSLVTTETNASSLPEDTDKKTDELSDSKYQQIILDCQEYLMSSGYSNVFPKMYQNLKLIETSIQNHPRGGFVDLLSGSSTREKESTKNESEPMESCEETATADETGNDNNSSTVSDEKEIARLKCSDNREIPPVPDEFYAARDVQQILKALEADEPLTEFAPTPISSNASNSGEDNCAFEDRPTIGNGNCTLTDNLTICQKVPKDYEHVWLSHTGEPYSSYSADIPGEFEVGRSTGNLSSGSGGINDREVSEMSRDEDSPRPVDFEPVLDLSAYKIVQQVLSSNCLKRSEFFKRNPSVDEVATLQPDSSDETDKKTNLEKPKKPQPLPRKNLPRKCLETAEWVNVGRSEIDGRQVEDSSVADKNADVALDTPIAVIGDGPFDGEFRLESDSRVSFYNGAESSSSETRCEDLQHPFYPRREMVIEESENEVDVSADVEEKCDDCIYSEVLKEKGKSGGCQELNEASDQHRPSVPSRLKRHLSFQQQGNPATEAAEVCHWRHTLPGRLSTYSKKVKLKGDQQWGETWDSDEEDTTPPVPEKTKEAYMLPTGDSVISSQNDSRDCVTSGNKPFSKFTILSKLGLKTDAKGFQGLPQSGKVASASDGGSSRFSTIGFPYRLPKKPQGPRHPPTNWTPLSHDVPS